MDLWYNVLMSLKLLLRLVGMGFLVLPISTAAYITPEQAVMDDWLWLPPTNTEAHDRVRMQQQRSAERREREQAAYFSAQHPPEPKQKDIESSFTKDLNDSPLETSSISDEEVRRMAQILERIDKQQANIYGNYGLGSVLHHRQAPVTDTGPASAAAGLALISVAIWTVRRAWRKTI
ncbi:hypothetical protein A3D11_01885 [Candidatus Peribacteria bacterium RIFCSPHIGHO2_02_FULL_49_16]|nr:MAG: hypothetical protein A3D11_01885 [Candidatus Peribacteria bacterium RIFCSPHIGHO2_02_FULL_49_16]